MNSNGNYKVGKFFGIKDFASSFGVSFGFLLLVNLPTFSIESNTLPTGYKVINGDVSVTKNGNILNVNSLSNSAILNYNDFNVGKDASVNFSLLNSSSVVLNRV